jgi:hypothetical protein
VVMNALPTGAIRSIGDNTEPSLASQTHALGGGAIPTQRSQAMRPPDAEVAMVSARMSRPLAHTYHSSRQDARDDGTHPSLRQFHRLKGSAQIPDQSAGAQ